MTWLRLETDAEFHFEFFLAEKLGRTITELRQTLTQREFVQWSIYYGRKAQQRELAAARGR